MAMLKLTDIRKTYQAGNTYVQALKGVSLAFRRSEFVSILGPSGCGKTTLLNIIGGLDRYDSGDLIINGVSTKQFRDSDWDAYRNRSIGFVFQTYNLIGHQSVLQNVEIAMTLSGISPAERKRRATEALNAVQLSDQLHKRPNQLSGGQMQRVAIARALVNNPDIILADEPTGALDTQTSIQIMNILKEVAKTRLVIMVTHNPEMAQTFSTRIIRLLDGAVISDTLPLTQAEMDAVCVPQEELSVAEAVGVKADAANGEGAAVKSAKGRKKYVDGKPQKTSMSFFTALNLSFKNLLTKKGRTILTAIAGSIGIIGVALVLSLSNGMSIQIKKIQTQSVDGIALNITAGTQLNIAETMNQTRGSGQQYEEFPAGDEIIRYNSNLAIYHTNEITQEYVDYVKGLDQRLYKSIEIESGTRMNLLTKFQDNNVQALAYTPQTGSMSSMSSLMGGSGYFTETSKRSGYLEENYEAINGRFPDQANAGEIALVVDKYNRLPDDFFTTFKFILTSGTKYTFSDFVGKELLKYVPNNDYYEKYFHDPTGVNREAYKAKTNLSELYENAFGLKITGILRVKEGAKDNYSVQGIVFTDALKEKLKSDSQASDAALLQQTVNYNVTSPGNVYRTDWPTNFPTNTGDPDTNKANETLNLTYAALNSSNRNTLQTLRFRLGGADTPMQIEIYPVDLTSKTKIKEYLDAYNNSHTDAKIVYTDMVELVFDTVGQFINGATYALVAFAAVSLVVSSIMIGIITYVSVIERTKEIGILRSVGARKKDISRVFNAETFIIGLVAGTIGVVISFLLTFPINWLINMLVAGGMKDLAQMSIWHVVGLIAGSTLLTMFAGLLPASWAAKKDPVVALRTE